MLSKKTKYGLKALSYLANCSNNVPVGTSQIAENEQISRKFLETILLVLKNGGLLGAKKGKQGGYYLLRKPQEIAMVEVIRLLEGPIAMLPCVSLNYYEKCEDCPDEKACAVHSLMIRVRDSTLRILENSTLADFTEKHTDL